VRFQVGSEALCAKGDSARHQDGDCDGDMECSSTVVASGKELCLVRSALRGTHWHCSLQFAPHVVFISASFSNLCFLHAMYYFSCVLIFHIQLFFVTNYIFQSCSRTDQQHVLHFLTCACRTAALSSLLLIPLSSKLLPSIERSRFFLLRHNILCIYRHLSRGVWTRVTLPLRSCTQQSPDIFGAYRRV